MLKYVISTSSGVSSDGRNTDLLYQQIIANYYYNHSAYLLLLVFSVSAVTITATESSAFHLGFFAFAPATTAFQVRGSVPGLGSLKETKLFLPHPRVKVSIVGSLRDREVACSASDRQGSNFESCVWRTVSSQSSHHPQEVLLAQFSLYVHKGGLKPDSFHFFTTAFQAPATNYFIACM